MRTFIRRAFFIGLFVAWCAAVNVALDNVNEGMGWLVDKAIAWVMPAAGAAERAPFASPSEGEFYAKLMQPDNVKTSCCGAADAYYADITEPCEKGDRPDCWLRAVITDTRPDSFEVMDEKGQTKTINRAHLDVGTRIVVPYTKQRKHYPENPTDHGVIFVANPASFEEYDMPKDGKTNTPSSFNVYCFEPLALL
jgi:hypothetical protein